ncbi:MAG: VOC family protein [Bacteroidota bacterium]|nr:VOC family protein [Bacteroidota bacterium]
MNLNQVTVSVSNIPRSAEFYKKLGLQMIVKEDHYCRFMAPGNEATFSIHKADKAEPGSTVIYFECGHLDEQVAELKSKGVVFDQDPVDQTWLWREAYLKDPDGHIICLYYAGKNRLDPPWRIKE